MNIKSLLESKGVKVVGLSDVGTRIDSINTRISEDLFTFLVNNQLNRYLFNVFMRVGSLEVENWPFNIDYFLPNKIKEKVKESFIKKFVCRICGQILIHEVSANLEKMDEKKTIECPKCKLSFDYEYTSLDDSFEISKRDIAEYLEQLSTRGILKFDFLRHCPMCRERKVVNPVDKESLICSKCNRHGNLTRSYIFSDEFFNHCLMRRGGEWFEWYVHKLCSYIHEEVAHNILIEVEIEGFKKELEIDVIGRDGDNLIIYECKDTKEKSDWKDFENIIYLTKKFDNIKIVNSYDSNKKIISELSKLCNKEIGSIRGSDLEDNFIGIEPTIVRLKSEEWPYSYQGINSFNKLSLEKKRKIVHSLLIDVLDNKDLLNNLNAIFKISKNESNFLDFNKDDKDILLLLFKNFLNKVNSNKLNEFIGNEVKGKIIDFITLFVKNFEKEKLLQSYSIEDYFKPIEDGLNGLFGEDYIPNFYNYTFVFFSVFEKDKSKLNSQRLNHFFDLFLPMLERYSSWRSQEKILALMKSLINLFDADRLKIFSLKLSNNLSSFSWSVNWEIADISKLIFPKVDESGKTIIRELLKKMSSSEEINSKRYAEDALKELEKL